MDLVTLELGITTGTRLGSNGRQRIQYLSRRDLPLGHAWEATEGNGIGKFRARNYYCDMLGTQREATDLVNFVLGINTATRLGGNGRQRIW